MFKVGDMVIAKPGAYTEESIRDFPYLAKPLKVYKLGSYMGIPTLLFSESAQWYADKFMLAESRYKKNLPDWF